MCTILNEKQQLNDIKTVNLQTCQNKVLKKQSSELEMSKISDAKVYRENVSIKQTEQININEKCCAGPNRAS